MICRRCKLLRYLGQKMDGKIARVAIERLVALEEESRHNGREESSLVV